MAAEYDKTRAIHAWNIPLVNLEDWKPDIVALLEEVGFFRLLEIDAGKPAASSTGTQLLQFRTGKRVAREEAAELTDSLKNMIVEAVPTLGNDEAFEATVMQLLGAIQEATENSCDHAYRDTSIPDYNRRWWATGAIDVGKRHLNLVVYDQGRSIPATLPEWDMYPFVASRLARLRRRLGTLLGNDDELDAVKVRLAMDAPLSSTGESHRGKGFGLFKTVVNQAKVARLRILSRRGEFIYQKGARPQIRALKTPLNGTLVEWDLWL